MLHRLLVSSRSPVQSRQVEVQPSIIRHLRQGLPINCLGFVVALHRRQRRSQIVAGSQVIWIESHGCPKGAHRSRVLSLLGLDASQIKVYFPCRPRNRPTAGQRWRRSPVRRQKPHRAPRDATAGPAPVAPARSGCIRQRATAAAPRAGDSVR